MILEPFWKLFSRTPPPQERRVEPVRTLPKGFAGETVIFWWWPYPGDLSMGRAITECL